MKSINQQVFELLGTTKMPTLRRDALINYIENYAYICSEKKEVERFRLGMLDILATHDAVQLQVFKDRHNGRFNLVITEGPVAELEDLLDCSSVLRYLWNLPDSMLVGEEARIDINNLDTIIDTFFTKDQNEVYEGVEQYEVNLLGDSIDNQKSSKIIKL